MGQIIIHVDTVDHDLKYIPYRDLPSGPTINQHYTLIEVEGEIPEGAEESFEEIVLEEALAEAMSKRQGY